MNEEGSVDGAKYFSHATSLFGEVTDVYGGSIELMGDGDDDDDDSVANEMMNEMEGEIMGVLWPFLGDVGGCCILNGNFEKEGTKGGVGSRKEVCWKKSHNTTLKGGLYCQVKPHPYNF